MLYLRDLREVAERADRVANVEQEPQSVGAHALVVRHHEHLVEEAVDRRAELGGGGDRPGEVALGDGGLDAGRGLAERLDQRHLGLVGRERGVERARGPVGLARPGGSSGRRRRRHGRTPPSGASAASVARELGDGAELGHAARARGAHELDRHVEDAFQPLEDEVGDVATGRP